MGWGQEDDESRQPRATHALRAGSSRLDFYRFAVPLTPQLQATRHEPGNFNARR